MDDEVRKGMEEKGWVFGGTTTTLKPGVLRPEPHPDMKSLLRVARAAKLYLEHGEPELADELEETLKEVEHLL